MPLLTGIRNAAIVSAHPHLHMFLAIGPSAAMTWLVDVHRQHLVRWLDVWVAE